VVNAERLPVIDYVVRRSTRARHSRITIAEDAQVIVVLPERAPAREADDLVRRHRAWVERHVARIRARRRALALRPSLAYGRVLTINGQPEIVRATTAAERAALERRLRRAARAAIVERVGARSPEMGVGVKRVTIRDQRTRWGSASQSGTLSFSWRLVLAPEWVLDYVVVHELAHLQVHGHDRRFWQFVAKHTSRATEARKWLREHHDEIRSALD
jgi:predicted metal-dependent hydrolase